MTRSTLPSGCSGCGWNLTPSSYRRFYCLICDPGGTREAVAHRAAHEAWLAKHPTGNDPYTDRNGDPR